MSETNNIQQVPVTIVTGFLGAGKTSLLNHILKGDHGRRIAVLVNDFGRVNIDASLIENRDGDIVSLENGCICCCLSDGLLATVMMLVRQDSPPEHILIETSGVSDPFEVAKIFLDPELKPYVPIEGIVTVVDAELAPTLNDKMLDMAKQQLLAADIAVINKIDLVDGNDLEKVHNWVKRISPRVRTLDVSNGQVPIEILFDLGGATQFLNTYANKQYQYRLHHDEPPFDTFTYESEEHLSLYKLHALLRQLPKSIFRAKGILNLAEKPKHPCVLQSTGRRATITVGQPWGDDTPRNQIVFIGAKGGVDENWLLTQLTGQ